MQIAITRPRLRSLMFCLCALLASAAHAHVDWDRINSVDPACLALYHFDAHSSMPGALLAVAEGLPANRGLTIGAASGTSMNAGHDTPESIFEPHALFLNSTQSAESTATLSGVDGDLTIECWFKWNEGATTATLQLGLTSGAKLTVARDAAVPANDRLGVAFTHGDYVSAPGFVDWPAVGDEEASLGVWRHLAVTIHSTGMHYDAGSGHDVYNAGSVARFFLNGHRLGVPNQTADIAGMRAHDDSKLCIRSVGGQMRVDEVTVWSKDWSENGSQHNPFANGRGNGLVTGVGAWALYR